MEDRTLEAGSGHVAKKGLSGAAGDWVAPVLVWILFIGMILATVAVLLAPLD